MDKKMDRRKKRTKTLLYRSLLDVMKEKGADRVTVSDLVEKADINRGTFYLHYSNADDLLKQVKEERWEGLRQRLNELDPYQYLIYASKNEPYPMLVKLLEYYSEHSDFFRIILGPKGDPAFVCKIKDYLRNLHVSKVLAVQPNIANSILPHDYMISYLADANLSIIHHWIENEKKHPTEAIARMIANIVASGEHHLFGIQKQ